MYCKSPQLNVAFKRTENIKNIKFVSCPRGDEYSGDADVSEDVEGELLRQAARRSVRFEGFQADAAPGRMGGLRHKLSTEGKKSQAKAQVRICSSL